MKLIGTIHIDIEGTRRLESLLERLNPQTMTIEWPSNMSIEESEKRITEERRRKISAINLMTDIPNVVKELVLEVYSNVGYDVLVPIQYAKRKGVMITPVDHPDLASMMNNTQDDYSHFTDGIKKGLGQLHQKAEMISYGSLRKELVKMIDKAYVDPLIFNEIDKYLTEKNITMTGEFSRLTDPEFKEQREQFMAGKILEIKPDVHIGGIVHSDEGYCKEDFLPLYKRLGKLVSQRIRLCEAIKD